ncbi:MAG: phage tail protein [Moorea sp. SIO3C2]|nr:phage tail protein [Moorena sp. SIO3C2]
MAILDLVPKFGATKTTSATDFKTKLGDGYLLSSRVPGSKREAWTITAPKLTNSEMLTTVSILEQYEGRTPFQWRPDANVGYRDFYCQSWSVTPLGVEQGDLIWEMTCQFVEVV